MTANGPCIRCGLRPAEPRLDWLHCEPCYQDVCNEVGAVQAEETDAISRLMANEGLSFVDAVERLGRERWLI